MGKDGLALQAKLGNRATVIRGEDWKMTNDKCPLSDERLGALEGLVVWKDMYSGDLDWDSVCAALRQAAIEAYKIGHEKGYQEGAENKG